MSVKLMSMVFDADLPPGEKLILLAMADHASDEGQGIYPGIERIAWKTGYGRRQVIRVINQLKEKGVLIKLGEHPKYKTVRYKLNIYALPSRESYTQNKRGDILTPPIPGSDIYDEGGDICDTQGVTFKHVGGDTMTPESSIKHQLNVIEEGGAAATSPRYNSAQTAAARQSFGDNRVREADRLYREITDQVCIPGDQRDTTLETLADILDHFRGDVSAATVSGKPVFTAWCNTRGKSGRYYSPVNTNWLTKWLEKLADKAPESDMERALRELDEKAKRYNP